jgi:hypothetical protein
VISLYAEIPFFDTSLPFKKKKIKIPGSGLSPKTLLSLSLRRRKRGVYFDASGQFRRNHRPLALPVPTRQHDNQLAGGEINACDIKLKLSTNRTRETDRHSLSAAT